MLWNLSQKRRKKNKEMYLWHILNIWNKREIKQNFFINWYIILINCILYLFRLFENSRSSPFKEWPLWLKKIMSCLLCSTYYLNQGIPLPRQTKRTVFRDCPFPIIVVNKTTRCVLLYINLIGINVIIIIVFILQSL